MLAAMEGLLENGNLPLEQQIGLLLSAGAAYEAHGQFDRAFAAFSEGKARKSLLARQEGCDYVREETESLVEQMAKLFPDRPRPIDCAPAKATPIFIVGMPRSGTTLIESVIAAHPEAFGAGELLALKEVQDQLLDWAKKASPNSISDAPELLLGAWRDAYLRGLPAAGDARVITDKQPANFRSLGLIRKLFPEARIIHVVRDPVETCFSIFRRDFLKSWRFANRFEDLAHYYACYERITRCWESVLGEEYLRLSYEDVVADFENAAKRIISHCGLSWREECLEFHRTDRIVSTFSAAQVRKPIDRNARRQSETYGPLLDPLRAALRGAGVRLEPPA
jgi:hypothetical protein